MAGIKVGCRFGAAIYGVMHYVILPLSAVHAVANPKGVKFIWEFCGHMFLVNVAHRVALVAWAILAAIESTCGVSIVLPLRKKSSFHSVAPFAKAVGFPRHRPEGRPQGRDGCARHDVQAVRPGPR